MFPSTFSIETEDGTRIGVGFESAAVVDARDGTPLGVFKFDSIVSEVGEPVSYVFDGTLFVLEEYGPVVNLLRVLPG